jgi:hypothetical protein
MVALGTNGGSQWQWKLGRPGKRANCEFRRVKLGCVKKPEQQFVFPKHYGKRDRRKPASALIANAV